MRDITLNCYDRESKNRILKEPIAELTELGWYIVLPGKQNDVTNILFSQTWIHNYEKLCSLDCLGVPEKQDKPDDYFYKKFGVILGVTIKPI